MTLDEVQGTPEEMFSWASQNDVRKEQGLWRASSHSGMFTIARATMKDAVFAAMVIERLLQERGL